MKNGNKTIMLSIAKWKKQVVTIKFFQKKSKSAFKFGPFLDIFGGVDKRAKNPYHIYQFSTFLKKNNTENDV